MLDRRVCSDPRTTQKNKWIHVYRHSSVENELTINHHKHAAYFRGTSCNACSYEYLDSLWPLFLTYPYISFCLRMNLINGILRSFIRCVEPWWMGMFHCDWYICGVSSSFLILDAGSSDHMMPLNKYSSGQIAVMIHHYINHSALQQLLMDELSVSGAYPAKEHGCMVFIRADLLLSALGCLSQWETVDGCFWI